MAWTKPGPGRPKGLLSTPSLDRIIRVSEAQEFAKDVVDDQTYRATIKARALAGTLPAGLEALLWYFRFGRPMEQRALETPPEQATPLSELSREELMARAQEIMAAIDNLPVNAPLPEVELPREQKQLPDITITARGSERVN